MAQQRTGIAALTALTVTVALAACSPATEPMPGGHHDTSSAAPATPGSSAGAFNDADVAFASGMIPHHEQAIEMADIILEKEGVDDRVVELAQQIKDAQGPEIAEMTSWLSAWGVATATGPSGHDGHGMMSEEDLTALADAGGPDASQMFLTQMIEHHEGAISMAETEASEGKNEDAIKLAERIIADQNEEIIEMKAMLDAS